MKIKTFFTTLAFIGLGLPLLFAQSKFEGISIKAAMQATELSDARAGMFRTTYSTDYNWNAGMYANWRLNGAFVLVPGVQYSRKGVLGVPYDSLAYDIHFQYLSFPIALQYRFDNFFLEAGIENSIRLSSKVTFRQDDISNIIVPAWNNRYDVGMLVGVGYRMPHLRFGLRVTQGLINQASGIFLTHINGSPSRELRFGRNHATEMWVGVDLVRR